MTRAFTNTEELAQQVRGDLDVLWAHLTLNEDSEYAYAALEGFAAVALRVISKTNPSKVRDAARTEWIKGLMDGKPETYRPSK
jgi:hypothetical protein